MNLKKLALSAVLISLAIVLSYVESFFPVFVAVPGVKIGLANIAILFALYKLGVREAFVISILRVVLSALLFGSVLSMVYSLSGAVVSLIIMSILKKTSLFSPVAVSVTGGVVHNLAQLAVAGLIVGFEVLKYYIPVLLLSGIATGIIIGLVSATLIKRIEIE